MGLELPLDVDIELGRTHDEDIGLGEKQEEDWNYCWTRIYSRTEKEEDDDIELELPLDVDIGLVRTHDEDIGRGYRTGKNA